MTEAEVREVREKASALWQNILDKFPRGSPEYLLINNNISLCLLRHSKALDQVGLEEKELFFILDDNACVQWVDFSSKATALVFEEWEEQGNILRIYNRKNYGSLFPSEESSVFESLFLKAP